MLTCQTHVSGINRNPCARLLLRHPLDQRILTRRCERSVTPASSLTCTAFALTWFLITHTSHSPYIYLTLPSLCVWYCTSTDNKPENSRSLTDSWIIATPVIVCICVELRLCFSFVFKHSFSLVNPLPSVTCVLFATTVFIVYSLDHTEVASTLFFSARLSPALLLLGRATSLRPSVGSV